MRIIVCLLMMLLLPLTACTGGVIVTETAQVLQMATQTQTVTVTETQTITPTTSTKLTDAIYGYFNAVLLLESYATRVSVGFYSTGKGNPVLLERDDPRFTELLQYLKDCSSGSVTTKTIITVKDGVTETVHRTVLYGRDRFLDFILKDGTTMRFTVSDEVWLETVDTIYNAKYYGSAFSDFLETILPRT